MEENNPSTSASASTETVIPKATQPEFRVWRPPRQGGSSSAPSLPESYFEPTASEIVALHQSRVAARERLVDGPLQTSVMREREEKKKEAKYPTTTIRVKFPDQTQLERTFPSTDKIRSVYAFVRNSLREDVKPIKFILYQTPPRRELKVSDPKVRDQNLYQLQLAPSSVLLLSFFDESLNHRNVPAPLAEEVLALAQDLPTPVITREPVVDVQTSVPKAITALEEKLPKWLKFAKK
ncbi:hypothetical protein CPB86DRAFT_759139 [Serendipita vermifera]|nr:hypothetical protein CPB86DRAFT_759139 [Serendipita vermifera]